jgi:hypothetical protein
MIIPVQFGFNCVYAKIDFTKQEWGQNYQNTYDKIERENQFKEIRQQLSEKIPNTIEKILSGRVIFNVLFLSLLAVYFHALSAPISVINSCA